MKKSQDHETVEGFRLQAAVYRRKAISQRANGHHEFALNLERWAEDWETKAAQLAGFTADQLELFGSRCVNCDD